MIPLVNLMNWSFNLACGCKRCMKVEINLKKASRTCFKWSVLSRLKNKPKTKGHSFIPHRVDSSLKQEQCIHDGADCNFEASDFPLLSVWVMRIPAYWDETPLSSVCPLTSLSGTISFPFHLLWPLYVPVHWALSFRRALNKLCLNGAGKLIRPDL